MKIFIPAAAVLAVLLCGIPGGVCGAAEAEQQLVYEGRITVDGKGFNGIGLFRFALVSDTGTSVWTSSPVAKASGIPDAPVKIAVKDGVYVVTLGDQQLGMQPMSAALAAEANGLKLRIWFDDGQHGVAQVEPDQPIVVAAPPPPPPAPKPPATVEQAVHQAPSPAVRPAATGIAPDQAAEILSELRQIRTLLARQAASQPAHGQAPAPQPQQPVNVRLPLKGSFTVGSADAPVTLVEFTDY